MKNRLTFTDIIGVLLDNKKKTYPQYRMIHDMFSLYFGEHTIESRDLSIDNSILYSRWCNGARPIPIEIIRTYDDDERWDKMRNDFNKKILPNLINEPNARSQAEMLIELGCYYAQGFYYAKPMPRDVFEGLLEKGKVLQDEKENKKGAWQRKP